MICSTAPGCVQRRMTIRSNPPGAYVYVDNYPVGPTPCSTDFVYYGTRQFRLVRDGCETLTVERKIRAPWYEWFGLDFFSENIVPFEIRDEQTLDFALAPQQIVPPNVLMARGEELRAANQAERVINAGPVIPPGPVVVGPAVPVDQVPPPGTILPPSPQPGAPLILPPPTYQPGPTIVAPPAPLPSPYPHVPGGKPPFNPYPPRPIRTYQPADGPLLQAPTQ